MFNNVKAKKRLTQVIIAFVVICMSVTGSFLLLEDTIDSANAATVDMNVASAANWHSAVNGRGSGDIINITVTADFDAGSALTTIPAGVTVNLNMNGKTIYRDFEGEGDGFMTYSYPASDNYFGIIRNSGTLNITGTGTIRMKQLGSFTQGSQRNEAIGRMAAIVNYASGTLNVSNGINIQAYSAFITPKSSSATERFADVFMYSIAIHNSGTVNCAGKLHAGTFTAGVANSGTSSYHYAFAYGIYGGTVNVTGGTITAEALSGALESTETCAEKNQVCNFAVGVYSNQATVKGDTTINTATTSWMSQDSFNIWKSGCNISWSVGVMYSTTNYPVIGASVDITSTFRVVDGEQVHVPGSANGWAYTVRVTDDPGDYGRRAYPVAGIPANNNASMHGDQDGEVTYATGFFGSQTVDSYGTTYSGMEQYLNAQSHFFIAEDAFYDYGRTTNTSYLTDVRGQVQKQSGAGSVETKTGYIRSGAPGVDGTQYLILYRYYKDSFTSSNLFKVSPSYDTTIQSTRATVKAGGTVTYKGSVNDASVAIAYNSGGASKNQNYYKFEGQTVELVPTGTFATRDPYKTNGWTANGTALTSNGVSTTSANTVVIYMNYVLKNPTSIRVVANDKTATIDQYTERTQFTATYTGASLVPGTDFKLGIIDMGVHLSVDTNDTSDDAVVTSVYDISGTGSGSGNNATAVTYKYSADQSTWTNGLPKDVGTYWIEVNVNADTTYAATGTYNRQGATGYITCTISKANLEIEGSSSRTGTYGKTYGELIPFSEYKAVGLGSDQLEGSWSFSVVGTGDYPDAGQETVHLVWTPTPNTKTANNYNATNFAVSLVVDKRAVNVNAGASFVTYGDFAPTYTIAYENLAPCDDAKKATWNEASEIEIFYNGAWTTYTAGIPAGEYTSRIKVFGGAADENNVFSVNVAEGKFTVQKRSIVYNAVAIDRDYNGTSAVDVKLNYVSGNYSTDVYDTVINTTGTLVAGPDAGEGKAVNVNKDYVTIKISSNYALVIDNVDNVTVNIGKATPTGVAVVADPATITYDSTKTLATATALHTTATNIEGNWAWKNASTVPTVDVATYTAVFTPSNTVNYKVIEQQVTLTVEQKEVVVSVKNFNIFYGDAVPAITGSITYTGFTGSDTVDTIGASGGTDTTTTYTRGSGIGTYPISVITTLASTNYSFKSVDSQIVVAPRALTVKANDMSVTYGANTPDFDDSDITITGFYGTDNVTNLNGTLVVTTDYVPGSDVGTYDIVASGYSAKNYAITYEAGTLTVDKATLTVKANDLIVTYGADAPAYVANNLYTVTGFVAGDTYETTAITGNPAFTTGYSSGKNTGSYPVRATVSAMSADNYTFTGAEATLTVNKATPVVTMVPGASVVNSHTFAEAEFDGTETVVNPNKGTMTVAGTFKFANGTTVAVWGSDGKYDAVFTPEDTDNYTTTTVKVYLEILEKAISGTPVIQGSAMAGSTLTVSLVSMDPTVAQYYTFQWYADDAAIAGANATTYKLKDSDIGKAIHVVLTANTTYGFTGTAKSAKTSLVIEALLETTAAQLNVVLPSEVEYDAMSHAATVTIADGYNPAYFGEITVKYNGNTARPVNAGTYIVTVDVGTPAAPEGGYPADTYYGPATGISVGEIVITKAPFTVDVIASDKVYDGTTTAYATVTGSGLKDEMDDVRIAEGSKFAFADARVGTDKEVKVTTMTLIGAQANNYEIKVNPVTASITPAPHPTA